jgi:hypothetical protein
MRDTVLALHDEGRWTAAGTRDLLRGLVASWLNPAAVPSEGGLPERERRLVPFAAWGLLLFVLGGLGFAKMIEYPEFAGAADHHPLLAWSLIVLVAAAGCTAIVMTAAAVVALVAVVSSRQPLWQVARPLLVVPLSMVALGATIALARATADGPADHTRQVAAFVALSVMTAICGAVCTVALMRVTLRVPNSRAVAASRRLAMLSIGVLTALGAIAVLSWTLVMAIESPSLLQEREGLLATPTLLTVVACLGAMVGGAGCCTRAAAGVIRGRRDSHPAPGRTAP